MEEFLYFIILYPSSQKDITFEEPEKNNQKLECIYSVEKIDEKYYIKIFKVPKLKGKNKQSNFCFEFEGEMNEYIISFKSKNFTFIFDVCLEFGKKIVPIRRKIDQNKIDYVEKLDYFINALKEKGNEEIINELYKDCIYLYSKNKSFYLLISLFIRIYKKKDLCNELIRIFNEINEYKKDNEKIVGNVKNLEFYSSKFEEIISESEHIIEENNYDPVYFYGIILCYLNYYDYKNYSKVEKELLDKRPEILYKILWIYNTYMINAINLNFNSLNEFIRFLIYKKDFFPFKIGLNYIRDLETFISIINKNKEYYYEYFRHEKDSRKYIITMNKNIRLKNKENSENDENIIKKEEIEKESLKENNKNINNNYEDKRYKIISEIKSIINFCEYNETILVNFSSEFWKYLLYYDIEPKQKNISFCLDLKKIFIKYYELVIKISEKNGECFVKQDIIDFYDLDEFDFLLKIMIYNNKNLSSVEKLCFLSHSNKVDIDDIFDSFELNDVNKEFIPCFRKINFEFIFKDKIEEYIYKLISKINNISDIGIITELINFRNIKKIQSKHIYFFLDHLIIKYDNIVEEEIKKLIND